MMISPETYYQAELEGKTREEILGEIDSLREDIGRLKREMEAGAAETAYPDRLTRIKCYREYLDRAVRALGEAGGRYEPTDEERRAAEFDRALEDVSRMEFSIGGFFGGCEERIYTAEGDRVRLERFHTFRMEPEDVLPSFPFTREEFTAGLREARIGEWETDYCNPYVLDGTQWSLGIEFGGKREPARFSGSNAYPYSFGDFLHFLGMDEEKPE